MPVFYAGEPGSQQPSAEATPIVVQPARVGALVAIATEHPAAAPGHTVLSRSVVAAPIGKR